MTDQTTSERLNFEDDDRHVMTVAGSRAGKGTSLIIPTLLTWRHSCVVMDPKGELATATAAFRVRELGQDVIVLDPFGETDGCEDFKASYNPLDTIDAEADAAVELAAAIASDIVVSSNDRDLHWDESSRQLIEGLILHVCETEPAETRNLARVRQLLIKGDPDFLEALEQEGETEITSAFDALWEHMAQSAVENETTSDAIVGAAESICAMGNNERGSVLSTARRNTRFLTSPAMKAILSETSFDIDDLKTNPNGQTIYLCLPARYMATHARFFRLVLGRIFWRMEELGLEAPATGGPVLCVLDEFPVLGHMELIEKAAGLMAGYHLKLWTIFQDLSQLQRHYRQSWQTFMANAGTLTFFANPDLTTLEWISKRLGDEDVVLETQGRSVSASKGKTQTEGESKQTGSSTQQTQGETANDMADLSKTATIQSGQNLFDFLLRRTAKTKTVSYSQSGSSGQSESQSRSTSTAKVENTSESTSTNQTIQRRPVQQPRDIALRYAREKKCMLVLKEGHAPMDMPRIAYFEDPAFDAVSNHSRKFQ